MYIFRGSDRLTMKSKRLGAHSKSPAHALLRFGNTNILGVFRIRNRKKVSEW